MTVLGVGGMIVFVVVCGILPGVLLLAHFLEWLMPGSTTLHMTSEEWYAARHTSLGARANTVVAIMSVMVVGAVIGVIFLPLSTDVGVIMAMGLVVFYVVWLFWYAWIKRRKVPLNYSNQGKNITIRSPYYGSKRKRRIRTRRNVQTRPRR